MDDGKGIFAGHNRKFFAEMPGGKYSIKIFLDRYTEEAIGTDDNGWGFRLFFPSVFTGRTVFTHQLFCTKAIEAVFVCSAGNFQLQHFVVFKIKGQQAIF
jgi:hypothetical protein